MNWRFVSLALPLSLALIAGGAMAAPSVKVGTLTVIKEGIDAAVEGQLKGGSNLAKFQLDKAADEDLAKLCALFPNMKELQITSAKKITNLAPLASLKSLTRNRKLNIFISKHFNHHLYPRNLLPSTLSAGRIHPGLGL